MAKIETKRLFTDTIAALAKSIFPFKEDIKIECLIGITIDKSDVKLININEYCASTETCAPKYYSSTEQLNHIKEEKSPKSATTSNKEDCKDAQKSSDSVKHKIISERSHKECLPSEDSGYTEVQKSIKMVQRPEGIVEQKEVEWKKYTAEGELLEQRKMEEVQPVDDPIYNHVDENFNEEEKDCGPSNDYYVNDEESYGDEYFEDDYHYNDGNNNNYPQQYPPYSKTTSRGFSRTPTRGVKRQMTPQMSAQQPFHNAKKMRGGQQPTSQLRGKKSQTQNFPYTKVIIQKPDNPRSNRKQPAAASGAPYNAKGKSNVQPNNLIFNNALNLVWQGKITVDAAIEMFNLPENQFKKQLMMDKDKMRKNGNRGGKKKGKAGSNSFNMAGEGVAWNWEDDGSDFDDASAHFEAY